MGQLEESLELKLDFTKLEKVGKQFSELLPVELVRINFINK